MFESLDIANMHQYSALSAWFVVRKLMQQYDVRNSAEGVQFYIYHNLVLCLVHYMSNCEFSCVVHVPSPTAMITVIDFNLAANLKP